MVVKCDACEKDLSRLAPRTCYVTDQGRITLCADCVKESSADAKVKQGIEEAARLEFAIDPQFKDKDKDWLKEIDDSNEDE